MNTFERLAKIVLKTYKLNPTALTPALRLDEFGVDSLGVALMLFDVEDEFKVKFTQDPGPLQTLADVVSYIDEAVNAQLKESDLQNAVSLHTS